MTFRHQRLFQMALMTFAHMRPVQIAEKLHLKPGTVRAHMRSELFKAQLAELASVVNKRAVESIMDRIDSEAWESLQTLVDIRDLDVEHTDTKAAPLYGQKKDAAKFLLGDLFLDRKVPKLGGIRGDENDRGVFRLALSREALQDMFGALADFRQPIDITPPLPLPAPRKVIVHDVDQLGNDLSDAESVFSRSIEGEEDSAAAAIRERARGNQRPGKLGSFHNRAPGSGWAA
jgi:hypothetical protein